MATPKCEYCRAKVPEGTQESTIRDAQYDFVDIDGNWRYGCIEHWQANRASRQLGIGHAQHLSKGSEPPPRPPGVESPPIPQLVKPQVRPQLIRPEPATRTNPVTGERKPREQKPRAPRDFQDMEPRDYVKADPRPGSVLAMTLDLIRTNGGATLDEINAVIGPKHDALKLMQWANENKGYGWKQDPVTKKISVAYNTK